MRGLVWGAVLGCVCFGYVCPRSAAQGVITSVAGADWLFPADRKPALDAPLGSFAGLTVAVDPSGNYFIGDGDNHMVMRVGADGILTVVAGNGLPAHSGDGGSATDAAIAFPSGVALDRAGNLYVSSALSRIRKITPAGIISTVAGNGQAGFGGDGGPATAASLNMPTGLAVDVAGNLYVADSRNHRIRRIDPSGTISTFAGTGQPTSQGDGVPATAAGLNLPLDVAVDAAGNVYIADSLNALLRKVSPDGIITTIAGLGVGAPEGVPARTSTVLPKAVAVDAQGSIYIGDLFPYSRIRKITPDGIIRTIAGSDSFGFSGDGGPALAASLSIPNGIAVNARGEVFVGDTGNGRIRRITTDGNIATVAGNGLFRTTPDGFPAVSSAIYLPESVTADGAGNLYVSEPFRNRVRKIDADGILTTIAGNGTQGYSGDGGPATAASFFLPSGLFFDRTGGNLYIADQLNSSIRRLDPSGVVTTVAGNGRPNFSGDGGPATAASLQFPRAATIDSAGSLYISDSGNNRIRRVSPDGIITTVAGTGRAAFSGDGGPAAVAAFSSPGEIIFDHAGGLLVADTGNQRVRRIDPTGIITTVAGNGRNGFGGDGGPALSASLSDPSGLAVDSAGALYIADQRNNRIRRVAPDGTITTVAGNGAGGLRGDGGPATSASLGGPTRIAFDSAGNLIIADRLNHRIRAVLANPPAFAADVTSLTFSAASGGAPTPPQRVRLTGSIPGLTFQAAVATGTDWLRVSPGAGSTPGSIEVAVDPSGLSPGTYTGAVTITSPVAAPLSITLSVALMVSPAAPPRLGVSPRSILFSLVQGTAASSQSLMVTNDGGGSLDFTAGADAPWLSVDPPGGTVTPLSPASLTLRANPAGLAPGTYSRQITVSSATTGEARAVPVTVTVSAPQPSLLLSQTGLTFTAVAGSGGVPPQSIAIINSGAGTLPWRIETTTLGGGPGWISVTATAGSSEALTAGTQVNVSVVPDGLAAGQYYARIDVVSESANNSPQSATVVLNVLPAGSDPGPVVQPTGVVFAARAGGDSPGSQTLTMSNVSATPVAFTSGKVTLEGGDWFVHLPAQGNIEAGQSARVVLQPDINGLGPGVYRAVLTFLFPGRATRTVSVLLVLTAADAVPGSGVAFAGGCSPTKLIPVFTSLGAESTPVAGWPNRMVIRVLDDCGNPMTTGSVVAEFSSGEPPLVLSSTQDGNWTGTWQARGAKGTEVTVTVSARVPETNLAGTASLTGNVAGNQDNPVIAVGGVVNGASLTAQTPVAPGTIVSIFGSKLSTASSSSTQLPLATDIAGTEVSIAGKRLPLISASDGQINAIIPFGIATSAQHQIIVKRGSSLGVPEPVTVAPAGPAVFTRDQTGKGQGVILDAAFLYVDPGNPARAGDAVVMYCAGLGSVDPVVPAGDSAPSSPPAATQNPLSVTIGGIPAQVIFAGLAPGFAGLYQVNAVVPAGVSPGDAVPVILTSGGLSSPTVTMSVR